jgi:hypothetical protein
MLAGLAALSLEYRPDHTSIFEKYQRIQIGMSAEEVESILGRQPRPIISPKWVLWSINDLDVWVLFVDGQAKEKLYWSSRTSWLDCFQNQMRRMFRLSRCSS